MGEREREREREGYKLGFSNSLFPRQINNLNQSGREIERNRERERERESKRERGLWT